MDYRTHAAKLFHTPPVFAVYMIEKVLRWVKGLGGLDAMKTRNDTKAAVLYNRIDKKRLLQRGWHGLTLAPT